MGKKGKNKDEAKTIVSEFSISMYCNQCERTVAKTISKLKGVEMFTTDMKNHKVVVKGKIEPQKVLKKLRKKTGKRVEIIVKEKEIIPDEPKDGPTNNSIFNNNYNDSEKSFLDRLEEASNNGATLDFCGEIMTTIFSDENPNACSIM